MPKKINPKIIILIGVFFTSFSSILTRISEAPSLAIATYRLGFTVLLIAPFFFSKHIYELKNMNKKTFMLCILSGIFLALHFASWISSIKYTSITSSTVLVNTQPVFVVIGSYLIYREKSSLRSVVSVLAAIGGSVIISLGDSSMGSNVLYGDFLAVIGALTVAAYMLIGRYARKNLSVTGYTFIVYTTCTATLLLMSIATSTPLTGYPIRELAIFLALAVVCTLLGHSIFNWGLGHVKSTFVSTAILGEPVLATIFAIVLLGEMPTLTRLIGGIVVIGGIYSFTMAEAAESRKAASGKSEAGITAIIEERKNQVQMKQ
ncbi:MAG TPA: DMT family transporter [Clostridia bacterium]|nr:DMT family transporter [Clostridia bacterium]